MKKPPRKICPLRAITTSLPSNCECAEDRCAWFHIDYDKANDIADGACALVHVADALKEFQHRPPVDDEPEPEPLSLDI